MVAATAAASPADVIVPVLAHDPAVVNVPPAARRVPALVQLVPLRVIVPPAPSAGEPNLSTIRSSS